MIQVKSGQAPWLVVVLITGLGFWCDVWSETVAVDYEREIRPLFEERCYRCHGAEKQRGGLRLDHKGAAFLGGDSGEAAIQSGDASGSRLVQLISSPDPDDRMPPANAPETALSLAEVELVRRWIIEGASWPGGEAKASVPEARGMQVTDEDRQHWSFLPLQNVRPPVVTDVSGLSTPVDAFIRRAQIERTLVPSPQADARTLVRRTYFGLIGLPPTPNEMAYWISRLERSGDAFDRMVDALLESPHYGERWARHWLDVARYADSNGMELDADRPNAYRFRDFVIRAFNRDLPFDTFIQWQLAGDEMAPHEPDAIAATGFIVAGVNTILPDKQMMEEKLRNRANELDDMVSTTGQALLGLTLACARCHDHKYDPLPTRDYYRLMRVFNAGDRAEVPMVSLEKLAAYEKTFAAWKREHDQAVEARDEWLKQARAPIEEQLWRARVVALDLSEEQKQILIEAKNSPEAKPLIKRFAKALEITERETVAALPAESQAVWRGLVDQVSVIDREKPAPLPKAFAFADFGPEPAETWFFERGNFLARNEKMDLGFLAVLTSGKTADDYWQAARDSRLRSDSTHQRRALAEWVTDVENGAGALLARVMVNRIWQHHFGLGLVSTASDFGARGDRPSHPELLEWLTAEFVRSGWSIKHLQRLILKSATYRQSSEFDSERAAIDPENRYLWRQRPVRLEAEVLRDAMLFAAGTLNRQLYGPAFKPPIQQEALQARNVRNPYPKNAEDTPETRRRTIYMFHKRVVQYPLLQAFDAPDAQQSCGRRMNTTVAPQALAILNDPFVRRRASEMAQRIEREGGEKLGEQIQVAFDLALGRLPDAREERQAADFVRQQTGRRAERGDDDVEARLLALTDFCHSLFGLNEFVYVD